MGDNGRKNPGTRCVNAGNDILLKMRAFDSALSAQAVTDVSGILIEVNGAFLRIWGYTEKQQALGRPIGDFMKSGSETSSLMNSLEKEGTWEGEFTGLKQNGTAFRGFGSASVVFDDNGGRIGFQASIVDITDRKKAEEGQRESEERFRVLFEGAPDAIFIADTQKGVILDANKAACRLLGRTRDQVIGMSQQDLYPSASRERSREVFYLHVGQSQRYGHSDLTEMTVLRKDGTEIPVEIHAQTVRLHRESVLMGTFRDISDRKKAEEELRRKQEFISNINNNLVSGMVYQVLVSGDGTRNTTYASGSVKRFYGVSADQFRHDKALPYSRVADEDRDKLAELENEAIRTRSVFNAEVRMVNPDGSIRWSSFTSHPTVLENGITRWDGIELDVTDRKMAEEELRRKEELISSINNNLISGMVYQLLRPKDGSRKFTYLSDSVLRMYGVSAEEAVTNPELIYARVLDEDREKVIRLEEEANRNLSVFRAEARLINPDGSLRWSSFVSNPTLLPDGSTQWDGIELDITERKLAEEQLKDERSMFMDGPTVVFKWARQEGWPVEYVSPNVFGLLGFKAEEFTERRRLYADIIHPDDLARVVEEVAEFDRSGNTAIQQEYRVIRADGEVRWLQESTKVKKNIEGKMTHYLGYVQDITDRKRAEAAIKREN